MNETIKNEIREHRQAYLASCKVIEEESIIKLAYTLAVPEDQVRAVWFEIRGADN